MAFSSSNYTFVDSTGTIIPNTEDVQQQIISEYQNAFNDQNLIVTPDTPQGMLIAAETIARTNFINNNALIANQINPNLSGGVYLDAICALTALQRSLQTYSQVIINMTGVAGTVIPTSVTIQDQNGNTYQNTASVTLNISGMASSTFQCTIPGPVLTPTTATWSIINGVLGLETVANPAASTVGTAQQSDASLRKQRINTLALQGQGLPEAIKSGLYALDPSVNLSFQENLSDVTQVINSVTMISHSIYVCVSDAGVVSSTGVPLISDYNVAYTLLSKKDAGCGWNNSGSFSQVGTLTTSSNAVSGLTGTSGMVVGMQVSGNGIPANTTIASIVDATDITLNNNATITGAITLTFTSVNIQSGILNSTITVTGLSSTSGFYPGMLVTGTGIPANTVIASVLTGTSITLSQAATVSATETLTFSQPYARAIPVTDPVSGQVYTVLFDRPELIGVFVRITFKLANTPSNVIQLMTSAITEYINGNLSNEPGWAVFNDVSCFELAGAINQVVPSVYLINVETTLASNPMGWSNSPITIGINQQAVLAGSIVFVPE